MIRGLDQAAKSLGITPEPKAMKKQLPTNETISGEEVPMMYRAQVEGRCSLMFAGNNQDLDKWKEEWICPNSQDLPRYQREEPILGLDGTIYRIKVELPFRLLSNCGQDSIIRPILGKNGIPYFSGSSVKGLFQRACDEVQSKKYCGDDKNLDPSSSAFRFHGAYPVGDWSGMHKVKVRKDGKEITETRYRMLDVIHPQQERQLGTDKKQNATALASISLYQPTMIFEFSSADPNINWKEVETIFWKAIALGVGGKTSIGYGLGGHNDQHPAIVPPPSSKAKTDVMLIGQGVSSTLRSGEAEFRPNLFKASLRGHLQRLLAGVIGDRKKLDSHIDRLFGSSSSPGAIQLFWEQRKEVIYSQFGATPTFEANGILHINASQKEDVELIERVLKFTFIMGGFGKSWRRASHKKFHKTYTKFEIGCHWELPSMDRSWMQIKSIADLKTFLEEIHQDYIKRFGGGKAVPLDWRESWHPERLSVYAVVTKESKAITLFHDDTFKKTPAISGRIIEKKFNKKTQKKEEKEKLIVSHVWHRMLPIEGENFLEIVTVFHTEPDKWEHPSEGDQLNKFINSLKDKGLSHVWGPTDDRSINAKKDKPRPRR
jgi:CRISPR-associated protein Cmr6